MRALVPAAALAALVACARAGAGALDAAGGLAFALSLSAP